MNKTKKKTDLKIALKLAQENEEMEQRLKQFKDQMAHQKATRKAWKNAKKPITFNQRKRGFKGLESDVKRLVGVKEEENGKPEENGLEKLISGSVADFIPFSIPKPPSVPKPSTFKTWRVPVFQSDEDGHDLVDLVDESHDVSSSNLLDGSFDADKSHASFAEALQTWRNGDKKTKSTIQSDDQAVKGNNRETSTQALISSLPIPFPFERSYLKYLKMAQTKDYLINLNQQRIKQQAVKQDKEEEEALQETLDWSKEEEEALQEILKNKKKPKQEEFKVIYEMKDVTDCEQEQIEQSLQDGNMVECIPHTKAVIIEEVAYTKVCQMNKALVIEAKRNPKLKLKLQRFKLEPIPSYILLQMMAAPINPSDINMVQGVYPLNPRWTSQGAVMGLEGVAKVLIGNEEFKQDDFVLPHNMSFNTWQSHVWVDPKQCFKVDSSITKKLSMEQIATISVNPSSAYRMLHDYKSLSSGDMVLQNCANSALGIQVIRMCKMLDLYSINIVRNRPDIEKLKTFLYKLGASSVLTEEEASTKLQVKAKLALNGASGPGTVTLARNLDKNGVMVTYGGMSRLPLTIPTSNLIFSNITIRGFWMTEWYKQHTMKDRRIMVERVAEFVQGFEPLVDKIFFKDMRDEELIRVLEREQDKLQGVGRKKMFVF